MAYKANVSKHHFEARPYQICHLIDANIETAYFRSIARCHDSNRFPVMIGSIKPEGALQRAMREMNIETFSLGVELRQQYPLAIWRLVQLIRRQRIALVHAHCFDPTAIGVIAARLAGVPFVFTRHHSDGNIRIGKKWHTQIDAWCARLADHVIAVSEVTRQIMIESERVPEHQITVIYNGMEPLRRPTSESVARVRQELNLGEMPVCLMIGRLHEEKGHRFLFAALPEIMAQVGPVKVLIAGEGPHRAQIEAEAEHAGVREVVQLLGQRDDIPELLTTSSVVVMPSLAESFGFVALEAMSLGKPIVAAATGGIPEVIADGATGLLVPPANSRALASAVCRILGDRKLAEALSKAGRARCAWFSFNRMIRGYEKVYERQFANA